MKKEQMKGFISGLLVAALALGLIGTAAATVGKRTVEVEYTDIKIELNGEKVTPMDANGNVVEPFAINGTTYLPVRAVSNILGLEVGWDGATSTVKLQKDENASENKAKCLAAATKFYKTLEDSFMTLEDEFNNIWKGTSNKTTLNVVLKNGENSEITARDQIKRTIESDQYYLSVWYESYKKTCGASEDDIAAYYEYQRLSNLLQSNIDSLASGVGNAQTISGTAGQSYADCQAQLRYARGGFWGAQIQFD